jgi:DNA-binding SARP family transcriptional activator
VNSAIRLRVLGSLELVAGGERNLVAGRRRAALLARLAAAHGRTVPTPRLVGDVWSTGISPRSLAALQSTLSLLRRVLEPDRRPRAESTILVTTPSGYALRLPEGAVDAWEFERLVLESGRREAPGPERLDRLERALSLWGGSAYAEFSGTAWADPEVERLDELYRQAVEHRAEALIATGQPDSAIVSLGSHTAAHPLREDGWCLLALALYRAGRQGDTLSALRRGRAALRDQLGVDPGPALRRLESDILAHDRQLTSALPRPRPERVSATGPRAERLVGREHELRRLHAAAGQVRAGGPAVAVVTGEAGMGKTALAGRLATELAAAGWLTGSGRCPDPAAGAPAGWAWTELVRGFAERVPPDQDTRAGIAALLDDQPPATGGRFLLHQAVAAYLRGLAGRAPLLVVLDDTHSVDRETLSLLTRLPDLLTGTALLLVVLYRPGDLAGAPAAAIGSLAKHVTERIALPGLSRPSVAELAGAVRGAEVDRAAARLVAERTGGNPLFVRELARALDLDDPAAVRATLPDGIRDVLRPRIASLSAPTRQFLEQAAVAGPEVNVALLGTALGIDEDAAIAAIEEALARGILSEAGGTRPRFAGELVRDALLAGVSVVRRTRLQASFAAVDHPSWPGEQLEVEVSMGS